MMGGGAFWDSMIVWLTVLPLLILGALVVVTRLAFRLAGKSIGWGRAAAYVLVALVTLQVIAVAVDLVWRQLG